MKKWLISILVVSIVSIAAVWAVGRLMKIASASTPASQFTQTAGAAPAPVSASPDHESILMDPAIDLAGREMMLEKIELEKRAEANRKAGETKPADKRIQEKMAAAKEPEPLTVETGIFEGSDGMVRPSQANITNYWRGILNGGIVILFAGSAAGQESQGLVVILTTSTDPTVSDVHFEYVPARQGIEKLRIITERDGLLILKDLTGRQVEFNLATKKFQ